MNHSFDYTEYINSLDWKRKCQGFIAKAGYVCQDCGASSEDEILQVHHLHYDTLRNETVNDVKVLCTKCHGVADVRRRSHNRWLRGLETWASKVYGEYWNDAYGYEFVAEQFNEWLESKENN